MTLNKKKTRIAMSVMMALEEEQSDFVDPDPLPSPTHHPSSRQLARSSVHLSLRLENGKPPSRTFCLTPSGFGFLSQVIKETERTKSTKDSKDSKGRDENVSSKVVNLDSFVDHSNDDDVKSLEDRMLIMQLQLELKKKKRARGR
ncbi:hypothetical protein BCON_0415g00050 [Botryotinia convoluta]|uniref:Uncharacterized protein n=1 Tax=Botryotinia convoluta TaxID=54673 RepID=A0A4Z1H7Q3_9HELO|nr:hypothetical protein BCON_0415g00050 [Botryotinia convoluta]